MRKPVLLTLIGGLFLSAPAMAQEGWEVEGAVTAGGIHSSVNSRDASKFEEYRDVDSGVLSNIFVRGHRGTVWFDGYGENFARDDQYLTLRGGSYDLYKYRLYSDSLRHDFLFGGLTPYSGAGSNSLNATFPNPNPANWNPLELGYKRTDNGGYFEWQGLAPWSFRADFNQVKFDGTKNGAASNGTSPGNGFVDLIIPIQYKTNNASAEVGYSTGTMNLSLNYLYSKFDNDNTSLQWTNPFFGNRIDSTYLAPDNHYQRIAANATFRGLPARSTFAVRYTWSEGKSDADLPLSALNGATAATAFGATNPNVPRYDGVVKDQTLTLTLASNPIRSVDTRVYYNYYKRANDSTDVVYNPVAGLNCAGTVCENELFHYTKHNVGVDAYWRFMPNNRVGAGWDYWSVDQNRIDYGDVRTNKFFVEWKNTALPNLSTRVKYTYLHRRSDYLLGNEGVNAGDPAFLERFTSAFDSSDLDRNEFKVTGDWSPMQFLDFSLEATLRDNKYKNITLGRTSDKRDEIYLSASYGDPSRVRVTAFGDYQRINYDSNHRQIGVGACTAATGPNCFDPSTPPNATVFNWSALNKDRNWGVGVGIDWAVMERLMLKGSVLYYKTDGSADISSQNNFGNPLPLTAFDDSKRTSLNLKGIYGYDKNWSFTLGYAYERWRYSDAGYDGYQYTIPFPGVVNNTSQSYLNGYLAFTNYNANIVYLLATYRFDTR